MALVLSLVISKALGGSASATSVETDQESNKWNYELSVYTYVPRDSHDYANPSFSADYNEWLHLEARYNYEALKTGSAWLGYNFSVPVEKVIKGSELTITPMVGGVFGNLTGIAPGYMIDASVEVARGTIELWTQGEYFFDSGTRTEDFFYSWSELSYAKPLLCLQAKPEVRVGMVVERTKSFGSEFDVRRGPLIGIRRKIGKGDHTIGFTTYWLSPGSSESTFVFAVNFEL